MLPAEKMMTADRCGRDCLSTESRRKKDIYAKDFHASFAACQVAEKRQQRTAFPAKKEHDRRGKYLAKKEGRLSKEGEEFESIF